MIPPDYLNQIVTGDARTLAERIPDASIDLIFTDPVYDRIEDYAWLADTAARVLKPDRACLVWCWIGDIPAIITATSPYLSYRWMIAHYKPGRIKNVFGQAGYNKWTPLLWFDKGRAPNPRWMDCFQTMPFSQDTRYQNAHQWSKDPDSIEMPLNAFSKQNDVIFDPFAGGGTVPAVCKMLDRNYIAFEIDAPIAERARLRVANTQAMHPIFLEEQTTMQVMA